MEKKTSSTHTIPIPMAMYITNTEQGLVTRRRDRIRVETFWVLCQITNWRTSNRWSTDVSS